MPNVDKVQLMPLAFNVDPAYLAIPKNIPNAKELYQKIDKELLKMQNRGEIFRTIYKYKKSHK